MVIEPAAGAVISVSEEKLDALASARRVLRAASSFAGQGDPQQGEQSALWPDEELPASLTAGAHAKTVSRRRRDVFAKSEGRCHYCTATLTLDGKWHVEHMMPRSLDGIDEIVNLVASCVTCNLSKSDSTAIEFVSRSQSLT